MTQPSFNPKNFQKEIKKQMITKEDLAKEIIKSGSCYTVRAVNFDRHCTNCPMYTNPNDDICLARRYARNLNKPTSEVVWADDYLKDLELQREKLKYLEGL